MNSGQSSSRSPSMARADSALSIETSETGSAVVAVGHRRDRPFVLADHEPLITILGHRREDPRVRGAWAGEEMLAPPVLQGLEQQHAG